MRNNKKDLERLHYYIDSGIDFEHRRIFFGNFDHTENTDFDQLNVVTAMRAIQKMADITNTKPIELHFLSYGGDVHSALALVDLIEYSGCDFHFYGYGAIMSAATFIMAVCKPGHRFLSEHARVMVHELADEMPWIKATDQQIAVQENLYLQDKIIQIYAKKTFMDETFWEAVIRKDLYLSPTDAIKLGLADKILPKRKRITKEDKRTPTDKKQVKSLVESIYRKLKLRAPGGIIVKSTNEEYEKVADYDNSVTITENKESLGGKEEKES